MSNLLTQKGEKEINTCTCGDCKPLKEAESEKTSFFSILNLLQKTRPMLHRLLHPCSSCV